FLLLMSSRHDVVVIGSGTGGYVAAIRAAQLGLQVAVVERDAVLGGTCLNRGCIPTKALLEHAHALDVVRDAPAWGIRLPAGAPTLDLAVVNTRKDDVVAGLTRGVEFLFRKHGIETIRGTARLGGTGSVDVVGDAPRSLSAREIIVATGSAPRALPDVPVDSTHVITSDHAIALEAVPESVAIIGSGAVGVEFASIFQRFGSRVTIVELMPAIVPVEDAAGSAELARGARE